MKPLAIDLFSGLGGWAEGLLAEGYEVVGFDIERHRYPERVLDAGAVKVGLNGVDFNNKGGGSENRSFNYANQVAPREAPMTGRWIEYPGQLVLQDVLTLHGSQFRDAALIVASPPCQAYSWMAMPWSRAKAKAAAIRADETGQMLADLNRLFDACFRIAGQASLAAGRKIPLVVENVRGAQPWVGRARWNYGSYYLWGDVPALMPATAHQPKLGSSPGRVFQDRPWGNVAGHREGTIKNNGGSWFRVSHNNVPHSRGDAVKGVGPAGGAHGMTRWTNPAEGFKVPGGGADGWFGENDHPLRQHHSGHAKRKQASAMIARIPLPLAAHIARIYR